MPTRKQRRRQEKSRRHEWEYVYVDEEGQETQVDPSELKPAKDERARDRNGKRATAGKQRPGARPVRTVQPPSWARVRKRALLVGPVVIIAMLLLNRNQPLTGRIVPAVVLLAFFLPFSYFTDSLAYRMFVKRQERQGQRRDRGSDR